MHLEKGDLTCSRKKIKINFQLFFSIFVPRECNNLLFKNSILDFLNFLKGKKIIAVSHKFHIGLEKKTFLLDLEHIEMIKRLGSSIHDVTQFRTILDPAPPWIVTHFVIKALVLFSQDPWPHSPHTMTSFMDEPYSRLQSFFFHNFGAI